MQNRPFSAPQFYAVSQFAEFLVRFARQAQLGPCEHEVTPEALTFLLLDPRADELRKLVVDTDRAVIGPVNLPRRRPARNLEGRTDGRA